MVFAHTPIPSTTDAFLEFMGFLGGFAPVIFFTIAGSNAVHLHKKYSIARIALFCSLIFFLGFTFNALVGRPLHRFFYFDVFQAIGCGVFIVAVLAVRVKSAASWFAIFVASLAVYALTPSVATTILTPDLNKTSFAFLPWISLFFFGAWLHQLSARAILRIAILAFCMIPVFALFHAAPGELVISRQKLWLPSVGIIFDKWVTSFEYLFLAFGLSGLMFALIAWNPATGRDRLFWEIGFLGRESLQFHYWHIFSILGLALIPPMVFNVLPMPALWLIVLSFGWLMTWVSHGAVAKQKRENKQPLLRSPTRWLVFLAVILGAAVALSAFPIFPQLFWIGLAAFFADQYRYLRPAILGVTPPKDDADIAVLAPSAEGAR